jgi:phytoene/squalene synthetase
MTISKNSLKTHNFEAYLVTKLFIRGYRGKLANLLYSYLRWVDDYVDDKNIEKSKQKKFLSRQLEIIRYLYKGNKTEIKNYFEKKISEVIKYDIKNGCRLKTVIYKMFEVFDFDVKRKNKIPAFRSLNENSIKIGDAYTRALLFFLSPELPYKENFSLAAYASHQVHLLRDFLKDKENGYLNISKEEITKYKIKEELTEDENFSLWIKDKLKNIKTLFKKGKKEFEKIPSLRARLTAYLFCSRYKKIIRKIEKNKYKLI